MINFDKRVFEESAGVIKSATEARVLSRKPATARRILLIHLSILLHDYTLTIVVGFFPPHLTSDWCQ